MTIHVKMQAGMMIGGLVLTLAGWIWAMYEASH
jgi:hypothetical protein